MQVSNFRRRQKTGARLQPRVPCFLRVAHPTTVSPPQKKVCNHFGTHTLTPYGSTAISLGWVGLGWVGLGWVRLGWVGLGWLGLGWVGLGWVGLGWVGLGWVGLHWVGLGRGFPASHQRRVDNGPKNPAPRVPSEVPAYFVVYRSSILQARMYSGLASSH